MQVEGSDPHVTIPFVLFIVYILPLRLKYRHFQRDGAVSNAPSCSGAVYSFRWRRLRYTENFRLSKFFLRITMNKLKSSQESYGENSFRKSFTRKQKMPLNRWQAEIETATTESSAKKLQGLSDMPKDDSLNYRILNFNSVFAEISQLIKCKQCDGNVRLQTEGTRSLGFKILVLCNVC